MMVCFQPLTLTGLLIAMSAGEELQSGEWNIGNVMDLKKK